MSIKTLLVAMVSFFALGQATAQAAPAQAAPAADPYLQYGGVTLKGGEPPAPRQPPAGLQFINWPGFRVADGTVEVFLQLSGATDYRVRQLRGAVWVTLSKVQVYLRNNFRPVITTAFPGPVKRFHLRQLKGDSVRLEIKLRRWSKPTVQVRTIGSYSYLVASFPIKH